MRSTDYTDSNNKATCPDTTYSSRLYLLGQVSSEVSKIPRAHRSRIHIANNIIFLAYTIQYKCPKSKNNGRTTKLQRNKRKLYSLLQFISIRSRKIGGGMSPNCSTGVAKFTDTLLSPDFDTPANTPTSVPTT